MLFKPAEFETATFFAQTENIIFENKGFQKQWCHNGHAISLTEFSLNTNLKWVVIVVFLNFLWCSVDGKKNDEYQYSEKRVCFQISLAQFGQGLTWYMCFSDLEYNLRSVYTGDFCRGNSMQFLSRLRTFAPIVSAHPYCARESHATSCIEHAR